MSTFAQMVVLIHGNASGLLGALTQANAGVGNFAARVGNATASINSYGGGFFRAQNSITQFGNVVVGASIRIAAFAASVNASLGRLIKDGAEFEQQMANLKAVVAAGFDHTQITQLNIEMTALAEKAREMGKIGIFSAAEVAQGMTEIAKAGYSTQQVMGAVEGVINLSIVGHLKLSEAAEIAAKTLNTFGLEAEDASRVADVLTRASNLSTVEVRDLGESFKYVGPIAHQLGITFEETAASLAALGKTGTLASRGGTAFQAMIRDLTQNNENMQRGLDRLGIAFEDVSPAMNSVQDIVGKFKEAGLTATMAIEMFGDRGVRAIVGLIDQYDSLVDLNKEVLNAGGEAKRAADIIQNTLQGQLKILANNIKDVGISLLVASGEAIQQFIDSIIKTVEQINYWISVNKELVKTITINVVEISAWGAAIGLVAGPIALLLGAVGSLGGLLTTVLRPALVAIGAALTSVGGFFIALANIAIFPIVAAIMLHFQMMKDIAIVVFNSLSGAWESFSNAMVSVYNGLIKPALDFLADKIVNLMASFGNLVTAGIPLWNVLGTVIGAVAVLITGALGVVVDLISVLIDGFSSLLTAGTAVWNWLTGTKDRTQEVIQAKLEFAEAMDKLSESVNKYNKALSGILPGFDTFIKSEKDIKKIADEIATATEGQKNRLLALLVSRDKAIDKNNQERASLIALIMEMEKASEAAIKSRAAAGSKIGAKEYEDATKKIQELNGKIFESRDKLAELSKVMNDADGSLARMGGTTAQVIETLKGIKQASIDYRTSTEQLNEVISEYLKIQGDVAEAETKVTELFLSGKDKEIAKLNEKLKKELDLLAQGVHGERAIAEESRRAMDVANAAGNTTAAENHKKQMEERLANATRMEKTLTDARAQIAQDEANIRRKYKEEEEKALADHHIKMLELEGKATDAKRAKAEQEYQEVLKKNRDKHQVAVNATQQEREDAEKALEEDNTRSKAVLDQTIANIDKDVAKHKQALDDKSKLEGLKAEESNKYEAQREDARQDLQRKLDAFDEDDKLSNEEKNQHKANAEQIASKRIKDINREEQEFKDRLRKEEIQKELNKNKAILEGQIQAIEKEQAGLSDSPTDKKKKAELEDAQKGLRLQLRDLELKAKQEKISLGLQSDTTGAIIEGAEGLERQEAASRRLNASTAQLQTLVQNYVKLREQAATADRVLQEAELSGASEGRLANIRRARDFAAARQALVGAQIGAVAQQRGMDLSADDIDNRMQTSALPVGVNAQARHAAQSAGAMLRAVNTMQTNISTIVRNIENKFNHLLGIAGSSAIATVQNFIDGWKSKEGEMLAAVQVTMDALKKILNPETKASPSLNDVMTASVESVVGGVHSMVSAVRGIGSNFTIGDIVGRNMSTFGTIGNAGISTSNTHTNNNNDNRSLVMNVNNRADINELMRKIHKNFGNSRRASSGL